MLKSLNQNLITKKRICIKTTKRVTRNIKQLQS